MRARLDLSGLRFGRLLVTALERRTTKHTYWVCDCDCGATTVIAGNSLRRGLSRSCGCLRHEVVQAVNRTHGDTIGRAISREYRVWCAMKNRCYNARVKGFPNYGGRGITVCAAWRDSFARFLADMGRCPRGLTLERQDNDGPYSPDNCVWASRRRQGGNKRNNVTVNLGGEPICVAEAARRLGVKPHVLYHRIARGWPESRWLEPPRAY